jgi:hypothetical protein
LPGRINGQLDSLNASRDNGGIKAIRSTGKFGIVFVADRLSGLSQKVCKERRFKHTGEIRQSTIGRIEYSQNFAIDTAKIGDIEEIDLPAKQTILEDFTGFAVRFVALKHEISL